jgi:cytochrome c556
MRKALFAAFAAAAVSLAALPALADMAAVVKDRQDTMKQLGGQMRTLGGFIKQGSGDQAQALAAVDGILSIAAIMETKFPAGSDMDSVSDPKTGAKPAIWAEWPKFQADIGIMQAEAEKLKVAIAGGDKGAMDAQFGELGRTGCGTCHQAFRAKID